MGSVTQHMREDLKRRRVDAAAMRSGSLGDLQACLPNLRRRAERLDVAVTNYKNIVVIRRNDPARYEGSDYRIALLSRVRVAA